jgi:hypothetical protein
MDMALIAVGVAPTISDHVDVRVCAAVLRVGRADFKYPSWSARFIHQVMAVGITTPERRAVAGAQCLLASVGDQRQFAFEHPDEFVLMAVPVTLTGLGSRLDNRQVDAELTQPCKARKPLAGLACAGLVEWARVRAAALRGHDGKVDFLHSTGHLNLRLSPLVDSPTRSIPHSDAAYRTLTISASGRKGE